jgi:molybdenum-dependent DNA-binding transcriptional regulator ModE
MEDKLKLSGGELAGDEMPCARAKRAEIGDALLQRYEALEKKHQREVEKYERQVRARAT